MSPLPSSGTPADSLPPPPDDWIARDKALHVGVSFLMTLSGQYVLTDKLGAEPEAALPLSAGATLAAGLAKEAWDAQRPVQALFSWRDLVADVLGIALAALVVAL